MQPEDFAQLKESVDQIKRDLEVIKNQQLRTPLDDASLQVLIQAVYNQKFDRITAKEVRYDTLTAI